VNCDARFIQFSRRPPRSACRARRGCTTRTSGIGIEFLAGQGQFGDQLFIEGIEDGRAVHPEGGDLAGPFDFQGLVHGGPQRFWKFGLRFSTKAAMPSF
jgi:hypothetical protein